tara:strand:+ start:1918 stop:2376 length:459 start_codon:yes stop_codon:yes gene_type:complete
MKKDINEAVKLDGKVDSLKKYIHSGRNHVTFKVSNKQVTIDTGSSPMFIENGDDVIAVGRIDSVGNMTPEIFANKSRKIYIQKSSVKAGVVGIFISILLAALFISSAISFSLDKFNSTSLGMMLPAVFCLWISVKVYKGTKDLKNMLSMLRS